MKDKISEYANIYTHKPRLRERRCLIYTIKNCRKYTFIRGFKNAIIKMCHDYMYQYDFFIPITLTKADGTVWCNSSDTDDYIATRNTYNMLTKPKQKIKNNAYTIEYVNNKLHRNVTCRNLLKVYRQ